MTRFTKKTAAVAVAILLVVAGAGAAYAFWTAGGSGTGTAATGTSAGLTVNQNSVLDPMYPGDSPQTLSGDFDNPNSGPIHVDSLTVSIDSVTDTSGAAITGCSADDYILSGPVMPVDADAPSEAGLPSVAARLQWSGATIQFNNTTANQDACKDAVVQLSYAVTGP